MTKVLITGANRGLGLALVEAYSEDAARVFACCRTPASADKLNALASQHPKIVSIHGLDVADAGSIASLRTALADESIDILINNAGVDGGPRQSIGTLDYAQFAPTFAVNTVGPLRLAQAFYPNLKAGFEKKIVTISSNLGSITNNTGSAYTIYRASKAAVNQLMKGLSHDYARDGIIVISLSPGWVKTDMGGPGAPLFPRESALGMKKVIHKLTIEDSGSFLDYQGKRVPW